MEVLRGDSLKVWYLCLNLNGKRKKFFYLFCRKCFFFGNFLVSNQCTKLLRSDYTSKVNNDGMDV